jgi:tetratricopeptide (TPR) repeat protein
MRARAVFESQAPGSATARAELSQNLGWIARGQEFVGQLGEAVDTFKAKIDLLQVQPGAAEDRPGQYQRALAHIDVSRLQLALGHLDAALAQAEQAVRELQPLVALDASNQDWQSGLVYAQVARADALQARGQAAQALQLLQATGDAVPALRQPAPRPGARDMALRARWLAAQAAAVGSAQAPVPEMAQLLDQALAADSQAQKFGTNFRRLLAGLALALGDGLAARGQGEAARVRWQQGLGVLGAAGDEPLSQALRAQLLLRQGQAQEALTLADSLVSGPLRHPMFLDLLARLGRPTRLEGSR